jgi:hypothetical protein
VSSEAEAALARAETAAAALVLERAPATRTSIAEATPPWGRTRIGRVAPLAWPARPCESEASTIRPARPIFRGVYPQLAAVDLLAIEPLDCLCRCLFARELYKSKAARATCFPVRTDVDVGDLPGS